MLRSWAALRQWGCVVTRCESKEVSQTAPPMETGWTWAALRGEMPLLACAVLWPSGSGCATGAEGVQPTQGRAVHAGERSPGAGGTSGEPGPRCRSGCFPPSRRQLGGFAHLSRSLLPGGTGRCSTASPEPLQGGTSWFVLCFVPWLR